MPSTTDSGTVTNTATADSDEVLPVSDSDDLAVTEDVTITIDKEFGPTFAVNDDTAVAGTNGLTFGVKITNTGISDADNVTIVDNAPAGIVFDTEDSAGCTITVGGNLSCTFAHLGAGASETVNVTYHVPSTTDSGTVTNTATADSDEVLPVSDSDDLAVTEDVTITIDKEFGPTFAVNDDTAVAGTNGLTFGVKITNTGISDADNVTIVDNAPAGIVFDTEDSAGCTITVGGNLSCTFAHLGAGASETVNVTYHVPSTTDSGTVTNTATADSDEVLPVSDSDDLAVTEDVTITIDKEFGPTFAVNDDTAVAGTNGLTFGVKITNTGSPTPTT